MSAKTLFDHYIDALVYLRKFSSKFEEPLSFVFFRTQVNRNVVATLVKDGMCLIYEDYYYDDELKRNVPGVSISMRGLWKLYRMGL